MLIRDFKYLFFPYLFVLQGRSRSHPMYFTLFDLYNVVISPIRRLLMSTCDRMLYHNVFFNMNHLKFTNI